VPGIAAKNHGTGMVFRPSLIHGCPGGVSEEKLKE
jgi:hypothetical protein